MGEDIPERGELVLVTVKQISSHGVYVSLDEYDGMRGFLHRSEVATGRVRHIERFIRMGQKEVLKVVRVNKARAEVDLSLKQVSKQEKKDKLIEVKQNDKAKNILDAVKGKLSLNAETSRKYESTLEDKFDTAYLALEAVAREGGQVLEDTGLPESYVHTLEEVAKEKITLPRVEISGVLEITSHLPNGIDVIKGALASAEQIEAPRAQVMIRYISAPKYRVAVEADDYKTAEKILKTAVEIVQDKMQKKGTVNFIRKKS
ncbi:MAG: translation initiation factor IF-2 subunit alpha [Thaumarchaeota archaeon]|nr:translation initiation factor IF-2 subunit alpha [Nitrososphaerota archaeon]MCL5317612.1 translation initiation factor IF-2 subunit alpha [Nitrososphaerota archaeon]